MKHFLAALIVFCTISAPVLAQDNIAISPVKPIAWVEASSEKTDTRIADWTDPKTESRIEIRAQKIVRKQHAETLYNALNDQLVKSNFRITAQPAEKKFPLIDAKERTGIWTEYEYTAADIPISVVTFAFSTSDTAYIVIGYFSKTNAADGISTLNTVITQTVDKSNMK